MSFKDFIVKSQLMKAERAVYSKRGEEVWVEESTVLNTNERSLIPKWL